MSTREELLAGLRLSAQGNANFVTPAQMSAFVAANAANLDRRPDSTNVVTWAPVRAESLERLKKLVTEWAPRCNALLKDDTVPSLLDLHQGFVSTAKLCSLGSVVRDFRGAVDRALKILLMNDSTEWEVRFWIADTKWPRGNTWFHAYAWATNKDLSHWPDFIVSSIFDVFSVLGAKEWKSKSKVRVKVLYLTDVLERHWFLKEIAWSSSHKPMQGARTSPWKIDFHVVAPFATPDALQITPKIEHFFPSLRLHWGAMQVIPTGADYIRNVFGKQFRAFTSVSTLRQVGLAPDDNAPVFEQDTLYSKDPEIRFATDLYEHLKSLCQAFPWVMDYGRYAALMPRERVSAAFPVLIAIGGMQPASWEASTTLVNFLSSLVWKQAGMSLFSCARCAAPATHVCGGCERTHYCANADCQQWHWVEGGHADECRLF